jgi:hypothetical protein
MSFCAIRQFLPGKSLAVSWVPAERARPARLALLNDGRDLFPIAHRRWVRPAYAAYDARRSMPINSTTSRDQDTHKGAIEDGRPNEGTNAPALDENGLPNDDTAIAQDALGANEDQSQG